MRPAAFEIIGVAGVENAALVVDGDLEPARNHDAAFLAVMGQRHPAGVAARFVAFFEDLQAAAEQIVADLAEGDRLLADLGQFVGAVERLARALRLDGEKLGKPLGWGAWGYCLYRGEVTLPNANGAGSIALHATDVLRFCYCLLRNGRWGDRQIVPAPYMELVGKPSRYNPHCMFSLQFEVNADGHVAGAPKDAYWKSGAGGFCLYVVPSLDLAIYKMGGGDNQYKEELTRIPQTLKYDGSRDGWKPIPRTPFHDGTLGGDDGLRRVLEMVCAAVRD